MKKSFSILALTLLAMFTQTLVAQDLGKYTEVITELSSKKYAGRGYTFNGVQKAGKYLEKQYKLAGVDEVTTQTFTQNINTFPNHAEMSVDGKALTPGTEFSMREFSTGAKGEYKLYYIDTNNFDAARMLQELNQPKYADYYIVIDFWFAIHTREFRENGLWQTQTPVAGAIYVWNTPLKFYKAYGQTVTEKPIVWASPDFPRNAKSIKINVDNKFLTDYPSDNVIAKINGKHSDSCIVFMAHYDHQGVFGKHLYFPGVNDNASGSAALITLAEYYSKPENKPEYDIWFLSVAGEESGLLGSSYFVEHPIFPLEKIIYVFNLDMIGDNNPEQYCEVSEQGMRGFHIMEKINEQEHFFTKLRKGDLAANSDHYPFAQKGVPCILFEQEDGDCFPFYHTAQDDMLHIQYETYPKIFKLVTRCTEQLTK